METLGNIGSLVDIGGSIYSAFQSPPKPQTGFKGRVVTPGYTFGGGQLTRLNNTGLDTQRRLQGALGGLRADVKPGFGQLSNALVQQYANQRAQSVGNLRSNLAQRGILGSSFADTAIGNIEAEMAQKESLARAQAYQQEFAATLDTIQQEAQIAQQQIGNQLAELGLALPYLAQVNQTVDKNAKNLAELAALKAFGIQYQDITGQAAPTQTPNPDKTGKRRRRNGEGRERPRRAM